MMRSLHPLVRRMPCLFVFCLMPLLAQAETTLKISTIVPAGTPFMQELRKADAEIRQRTEERVSLKLFPGGVMGSDQSVLRKMRIGQLHGAVITAAGTQRIHPDVQVYSLPFTFRSHEEIEYVRERLDPVIRERVAERGYVLAGMTEGGFTYLFSKQPIRRLEDLRDARLWAPEGDEISLRMLESAGARVVSLPLSDVYTSLQTGLIDAVTVNPAGAIALQWHTGVRYQLDAPLLLLMAMLVFDESALERLRPEDRETVLEILGAAFERLDEINREANRQAQEALIEQGMELIEPARPPDQRRWQTIADDTLRTMANEGAFDTGLFERVNSLVAEYRNRVAEQSDTP